MVKTILKIEGMMCGMCEAHINDVIRKTVPDAKKVSSSHKKGESTFISEKEADEQLLKEAISQTGYELTDYKVEEYKPKFGLF